MAGEPSKGVIPGLGGIPEILTTGEQIVDVQPADLTPIAEGLARAEEKKKKPKYEAPTLDYKGVFPPDREALQRDGMEFYKWDAENYNPGDPTYEMEKAKRQDELLGKIEDSTVFNDKYSEKYNEVTKSADEYENVDVLGNMIESSYSPEVPSYEMLGYRMGELGKVQKKVEPIDFLTERDAVAKRIAIDVEEEGITTTTQARESSIKRQVEDYLSSPNGLLDIQSEVAKGKSELEARNDVESSIRERLKKEKRLDEPRAEAEDKKAPRSGFGWYETGNLRYTLTETAPTISGGTVNTIGESVDDFGEAVRQTEQYQNLSASGKEKLDAIINEKQRLLQKKFELASKGKSFIAVSQVGGGANSIQQWIDSSGSPVEGRLMGFNKDNEIVVLSKTGTISTKVGGVTVSTPNYEILNLPFNEENAGRVGAEYKTPSDLNAFRQQLRGGAQTMTTRERVAHPAEETTESWSAKWAKMVGMGGKTYTKQ